VQITADSGYYEGYGKDVLFVYDARVGFATRSGWLYLPGTKKDETNYLADPTNFSFTMKYTKKGTNVKGSLLLIRHPGDGLIYRIRSNALNSLAFGESIDTSGWYGWTSFSGKATYLEPDLIDRIGNHEVIVYEVSISVSNSDVSLYHSISQKCA